MYNVFSTREIGVLKVVDLMLTARQMLIFKCIVEEFIENAEPVGSKALMMKYQLPYSSATIRNEMNFLENYGYLEKTHISSGRVPSKEGYRFYVHNLGKVDLDEGTKNQVATIINKHRRNLNEMVHESCNMLSELTHLTSVALGNASDDTLQRISVVPLDDGRVTDSKGRTVDFKNTILIMTSNLGAEYLLDGIDEDGNIRPEAEQKVMEKLRLSFKPEFLNRLDETIMFKPLTRDNIRGIIDLLIADLNRRLADRELTVELTDAAKDKVVEDAYEPAYGARPLKRYIQKYVETLSAKLILADQVQMGDTILIAVENGELVAKKKQHSV